MDLSQLLKVYGEASGKTVEADSDIKLSEVLVATRTQTPLTRSEVLYAFYIMLGLNGFEVLSQADGHAKLVRIQKN